MQEDTKPMAHAAGRTFRWLHYGSCLFRIAFDTPAFRKGEFHGMPVQVSRLWRREISAVISDWEVADTVAAQQASSPFTDSWAVSRAVFAGADVVLVDLVLDIFQPRCLRFRRDGEAGGTPFDLVVSNFPDEPPSQFQAAIGVFETDMESSLAAWRKFGETIDTPVVFITMENRDDVPPGYTANFRAGLLRYQQGLTELAARFPHWLVLSMDDLFAEKGVACYVDRHHPSALGWDVLRESIPRLIESSGILKPDCGGAPLSIRNWNVPERCDFEVLDLEHMKRLAQFGQATSIVGPPRLTNRVAPIFGDQIELSNSFATIGQPKPASLIIILKWNQPVELPVWLDGLLKKHEGAVVEIPTLWRGRERMMMSDAEHRLRGDLKRFAAGTLDKSIRVAFGDTSLSRYVARCLLSTHVPSWDAELLVPRAATDTATSIDVPIVLIEGLKAIRRIPVFSVHS